MQNDAAQSPNSVRDGEMVVLNERYGIMPRSRLPVLDSPTAEAYQVADLHSGTVNLYALVCTPGLRENDQTSVKTSGLRSLPPDTRRPVSRSAL